MQVELITQMFLQIGSIDLKKKLSLLYYKLEHKIN